ncbi:hypothetical protein [Fontivita pretiosa]|uniref:hypothetical protein n=1 Tax=Fontivita pretiosa TaxID=2989684 RepID=UPI003D163B5D
MARTASRQHTKDPNGAKKAVVYVKPGMESDFLLKMQQPIRTNAVRAMHAIYGEKPKPSEGQWLGYLIALGTLQALKQAGVGAKGPRERPITAKR